MKAGRGELTLLTSSSSFNNCSSDLSLPESVVMEDSVSIERDSERLSSSLLELVPVGVLLSTALVFCLCPAGEEKVGFWLTVFRT